MTVLDPVAPDQVEWAALETRMKDVALATDPTPHRFVPERDGRWDGYAYEIDPRFQDLAERPERHRRSAFTIGEAMPD